MKNPVLVVRQEGELWKWCYRYDGERAQETHLSSSESFPSPDGAAEAARSAYPDLPVVDEHGVPFRVSPEHAVHGHPRLLLLGCAAAVVAWWLLRRRARRRSSQEQLVSGRRARRAGRATRPAGRR